MTNHLSPLRIGVLGCAGIAIRSVIPAIQELRTEFRLVAVASRTMVKARTIADQFQCKPASYDELIAAKDVDVLYVPLPTGLHREWIGKALRAGKHVYAEKSVAYCHDDAQELVALAKHGNLALMEGLMFQYHRQQRQATKLLAEGAIGDVRHFWGAFGFPPLERTNFRYDEATGGGALLDAAAYPLRAAHRLLGDSVVVKGATLFVDAACGTNTYGSAFLSDSRGLGATIAFGFDNFYQCRYEIWGAKGKMTLPRAYTPRPDFGPEIILETATGSRTIAVDPDNHFVRAFEEFRRAVRESECRQAHYRDILLQSRSLEEIRRLSTEDANSAVGSA